MTARDVCDTHIVAILQGGIHSRIHVVVVQGHEQRVDDNAERDKQVDEGVEDHERQVLKRHDIAWHSMTLHDIILTSDSLMYTQQQSQTQKMSMNFVHASAILSLKWKPSPSSSSSSIMLIFLDSLKYMSRWVM